MRREAMRQRFWNRGTQAVPAGVTTAGTNETTAGAIFYDVTMRRLDEQMERSDTLDGKAAGAFSVGSAVLPVTFGLLNLGTRTIPLYVEYILFGAGAMYVLLLLFSWLSYFQPRTMDYRPDLLTLKENSAGYSGEVLQEWVARECVTSIGANEYRLSRKAQYVSIAMGFLHVEAALQSIAALLALR